MLKSPSVRRTLPDSVNKSASPLEIRSGECFSWRRIRCGSQRCLIRSLATDVHEWFIQLSVCNASRAAQTCAEWSEMSVCIADDSRFLRSFEVLWKLSRSWSSCRLAGWYYWDLDQNIKWLFVQKKCCCVFKTRWHQSNTSDAHWTLAVLFTNECTCVVIRLFGLCFWNLL